MALVKVRSIFVLYCLCSAGPQLFAGGETVARDRVHNGAIDASFVRQLLIEGRDVQFKHLNSAGLSQTRVAQILQDNQGFIWFGTQNGLNRYDGYRFKTFKHDSGSPNSLSGVYIYSLFKDRSGTIWVGSDQFLDRFDPITETFTRLRIDVRDPAGPVPVNFSHISQDRADRIWLSTRNGLYRFDPGSGKIAHYGHDSLDPLSLSDNDIKMTGEDREGNFWVSTSNSLDKFDRHSGKVVMHVPLGESGMGLLFHEDRHGVFWIIYGPDGRLATFDRASNRITRYSLHREDRFAPAMSPFCAMLEDREGTMWFGTGGDGVLKLDRDHNRFLSYSLRAGDPESLPDTRVTTLYQDDEGNIWTGLHQAPPTFFSPKQASFRKFTFQSGNPESLGSSLVSVVYQDRKGLLWIGADRVIKRLDRKTDHYSTFPLIRGNEVFSIIEQEPDTIWFATGGQGLKRYNQRTGELKTFRNDPADPSSICSNFIEKLIRDREGFFWAATWDGLSRFDPVTERFTNYKPDAKFRGVTYHAITKSYDGLLWLGSNVGLQRFDPATGRFTLFQHDPTDANSLSDNRVNSIYESRDGSIWVGTQNGLDKFSSHPAAFAHFNERYGIDGNVLSCILEDKRGRLWMSTNQGLAKFDPGTHEVNNYTAADGLPGPDLTGWGVCSQSNSGEMFFGGFSGAVAFYPEKVVNSSYVPPVVLTDLRLFGTSVGLSAGSPLTTSITHTNSITLSHAQNIISIEFAALSYFNSATNRHRYKLEGLQEQWSEIPANERIATYTTLPAGTYTFRVQGATSRGNWSEPGATLHIRVLPPWWATWSFRAFCLALVSILIWSLYRYRLHQLALQYHVRLEERVGERTRIARELHDTLLQSFQGLMFRLQAVRDLLPHRAAEASLVLDTALDKCDHALDEAREAVQGLRSSAFVHDDLVQGVGAIAEEVCKVDRGVSTAAFRLLSEGQPFPLDRLFQGELYQITREALGNAFRHAHARKVEAEIIYSERLLVLRFRDDGCGIDPEIRDRGYRSGHWGLLGMRERTGTVRRQVRTLESTGSWH